MKTISKAGSERNVVADVVSNEILLNRCRKGDQNAVHTLLRRFEGQINGLAYKMTGNYDDANDVAAEAYLRICRMIGSCRSAEALPAWVSRVVANAYYDLCRRSMRTPAVSLDSIVEKSDDAYLVADETNTNSPERYVVAREKRRLLDKAIAALPKNQRDIIQQFYLDEQSHEEISGSMGIAVGTVKSRLNRARMMLQQKLTIHQTALMS
ncbi:MAG: sigma-70 family RNA polymerase sigma factor [Chthonomonadaceae bacterium]|nr:sigma-70 family RNA polymerase sigma factor [Chthonomonadaceae bacterium]